MKKVGGRGGEMGWKKEDEEKTKAKENEIGEGKRNGCCEG